MATEEEILKKYGVPEEPKEAISEEAILAKHGVPTDEKSQERERMREEHASKMMDFSLDGYSPGLKAAAAIAGHGLLSKIPSLFSPSITKELVRAEGGLLNAKGAPAMKEVIVEGPSAAGRALSVGSKALKSVGSKAKTVAKVGGMGIGAGGAYGLLKKLELID